jgi:hypothetical protein
MTIDYSYMFFFYCSTISIKVLPHEIPSRVDVGTTLKWQIHSIGFLLFNFFFYFYEKKSKNVIVNVCCSLC